MKEKIKSRKNMYLLAHLKLLLNIALNDHNYNLLASSLVYQNSATVFDPAYSFWTLNQTLDYQAYTHFYFSDDSFDYCDLYTDTIFRKWVAQLWCLFCYLNKSLRCQDEVVKLIKVRENRYNYKSVSIVS